MEMQLNSVIQSFSYFLQLKSPKPDQVPSVLSNSLISFFHIILITIQFMSYKTDLCGDAYVQSRNQHNLEHPKVKIEDHGNKYSFSSYHMNIISGNGEIQTTERIPELGPSQTFNFMKYYKPHVYQSPQSFIQQQHIEVLNNIYQALNSQSQLLTCLMEKNELNSRTTAQIYQQINKKIKTQHKELQMPDQLVKSQSSKIQFAQALNSSDITTNELVSLLYQPKPDFKFKLIIDQDNPLEKTLYRQRNFKLKINLIDNDYKLFQNSNRIPISLALYTVQNPPKILESNTLGNKMIKGVTEQDLISGVCCFQKLQIKQVTSHYRKGMLFLVAFAKQPSQFGSVKNDNYVDYSLIHPLIIDKLIVKAKKIKSKQESQIGKEYKIQQNSEK